MMALPIKNLYGSWIGRRFTCAILPVTVKLEGISVEPMVDSAAAAATETAETEAVVVEEAEGEDNGRRRESTT